MAKVARAQEFPLEKGVRGIFNALQINYLMEAVFMKKRDSQSAMIYDEILQRMGPEKRLLKAFELSEFSKQLFICGLKKRHPDISEDEFKKIVIQELIKCHNLNY